MKVNSVLVRFILLSAYSFVPIGCDESPVESKNNSTVLYTESFEKDSTPSHEGWRFGREELATLVKEAPPLGGNWSLQLSSDWAPTSGYAYRSVPGVKSGDIVKFSAYVRGTGKFGGTGILVLSTGQYYDIGKVKSSSSRESFWSLVSIIDTVVLGQNDSLWIGLSSPITEITPYQQEFDVIKIEKINE